MPACERDDRPPACRVIPRSCSLKPIAWPASGHLATHQLKKLQATSPPIRPPYQTVRQTAWPVARQTAYHSPALASSQSPSGDDLVAVRSPDTRTPSLSIDSLHDFAPGSTAHLVSARPLSRQPTSGRDGRPPVWMLTFQPARLIAPLTVNASVNATSDDIFTLPPTYPSAYRSHQSTIMMPFDWKWSHVLVAWYLH